MTRKHKLLIIDDEVDLCLVPGEPPRRRFYQALEDVFDIEFATDAATLPQLLRRTDIDAIVLDFILAAWGEVEAANVLDQIGRHLPVALVSHHWQPNFEGLRNILADRQDCQLFTWDEFTRPDKLSMVAFRIESAIQMRAGLALQKMREDEPFRILHLSDLQFGSEQPHMFETDTSLTLRSIALRWPEPPHFLILSGDIAEKGRPSEFEEAAAWLRSFGEKLGSAWSDRNVLLAPGNHDVSRSLAIAARVDSGDRSISSDGLIQPDLKPYAFAPFREFALSFGDPEHWSKNRHYWISGRHRDQGLILFAYNSCQDIDDWGCETRTLDDSTLAKMFDEIRALKRDAPDALVLGIMHHPFDEEEEPVLNTMAFRKNLVEELGTVVLMTGHVHQDTCDLKSGGKFGFLQIGCPTLTKLSDKRPQDSRRGYNLVEVRRSGGVVTTVEVRPFLFSQRDVLSDRPRVFLRRSNGRLVEDDDLETAAPV